MSEFELWQLVEEARYLAAMEEGRQWYEEESADDEVANR